MVLHELFFCVVNSECIWASTYTINPICFRYGQVQTHEQMLEIRAAGRRMGLSFVEHMAVALYPVRSLDYIVAPLLLRVQSLTFLCMVKLFQPATCRGHREQATFARVDLLVVLLLCVNVFHGI